MGAIYFVIYDIKNPPKNFNFSDFTKSKHRGPSSSNFVTDTTQSLSQIDKNKINYTLSKKEILEYKQFIFLSGYHRLSINDLSVSGNQPFESPILHKIYEYPELINKTKKTLLCNGEIYNYNEIKNEENFTDKDLSSNCDVEILLPMFEKYGLEEMLKKINGDFSFVLTENLDSYLLKNINIFAVRDIFGTKPLYMVKNPKISFYMFVTELKSIPIQFLTDSNYTIKEVPPGTYWSFNNSVINKSNIDFIRYSDWNYYKDLNNCKITETDPDTLSNVYSKIRELLTKSVIDRYNLSNQPVGILMSGGFDSSIILSILIKYLISIGHNFEEYPVYTFTIGDKNNTDVQNSLKIIEYLEKKHNIDIKQHVITIQDIKENQLNILNNLVFQIETYDVDSLKKGIPFAYLFDYIKKYTNVKILLSGEGLDELCGYNKLFKKTDCYFQEKSVKFIKHLSKFNLGRIDKLSGNYGLEVRYPFLDRDFVEYVLQIHPKLKSPQIYSYSRKTIEKYIIRKAFDVELDEIKYLNNETLWRSLQCPSKSIKYITSSDYLNIIENDYTDFFFNEYIKNCKNFIIPKTKEEMHFQIVYNKHFPFTSDLLPDYYYNLF
jgi:asparagine synthase (glutamine-hydrolysing)